MLGIEVVRIYHNMDVGDMSMTVTEIVVALLVAIMGSSALTTTLNHFFAKKDRRTNNDKATMFCLLSCIQTEGRRIINQGYVSRLEHEQFCEMVTCYKDMGGDGYADELKKQVDDIFKLSIQGGIV